MQGMPLFSRLGEVFSYTTANGHLVDVKIYPHCLYLAGPKHIKLDQEEAKEKITKALGLQTYKATWSPSGTKALIEYQS